MNRPLLRARLRRHLIDIQRDISEMPMPGEGSMMHAFEACEAVHGSDAIADRVLDRLSAEHGSGGLLDLLLAIDWVKLLEVILAVVALFKSEQAASTTNAWSQLGTTDWAERPIDRKADKEEAEAKRERLDQLRQAESD